LDTAIENQQVHNKAAGSHAASVAWASEKNADKKSRLAVSLAAFLGIFFRFTVYELPFPSPAASEMHKNKRKRKESRISCGQFYHNMLQRKQG